MQIFKSKKSKNVEKYKQSDHYEKGLNNTIKITTNHKHLLCDDSEINRLVLKKFLDKKNIICDETCDGLQCIDKVTQNGVYDIIWLDIQMPRMNGYECVETLRKKYNYNGIVIGLTGYIDQNSVDHAISKGMNHIMGKPINMDILYTYADKYKNFMY